MNYVITLILALTSIVAMAESINSQTELGCELYTGEPSGLKGLSKYNISAQDSEGTRVIDAFNIEKRGLCYLFDTEYRGVDEGIRCDLHNQDNQHVEVILNFDDIRGGEIFGTAYVKNTWWFGYTSHQTYCYIINPLDEDN